MAQTSLGDIRVNDAHVHFFSHHFYSLLAKQRKVESAEALGPLLEWEIPSIDPVGLARQWVEELNRYGVARAALIGSVHGDEESIAAAVGAYPDRFFGYFMLDPTKSDAVDRMRRAAANPYLHCVCLFPAMHTYAITDARLVPILELASDSRMAVFVHCGALSVGVRSKLGLRSQYDLRYSNPLDLHPVALHFPFLRFIVPHFGAGFLRETLMLADLCSNVWLDTSSSNKWMAYEGLDLRGVFRRTLDLLGAERLLFGTDSSFFPRGWQAGLLEQQSKALYELGMTAAQGEQILSSNLERMFENRAMLFQNDAVSR